MNRIVLIFSLLALAALAQSKPGTTVESKIVVPAGADAGTEIPITTITGAKPGPTLAIIAGLSGTEYAPVSALQQVASNLVPAQLSGSIILITVANVPAFYERSIYLTSIDHKDLTRVFPGKADGTVSERIAHAISTQVLQKADALIVLQAGGANTMLQNYVVQPVTGDAKLDARMASMALSFGISTIVTDRKPVKTSIEASVLARSKPVLKVFCGSFSVSDSRSSDTLTKGLLSMMNLLDMVKDGGARTRSPVFYDQLTTIDSPLTGLLSVYIQRGQNMRKGEPIFGIAGFSGKNPTVINAPGDGVVLSVVSTPPINKGEPVLVYAVPREP